MIYSSAQGSLAGSSAALTHDELVRRAVKWLKTAIHHPPRRPGCGVAVPEIVTRAHEQPDALGWMDGGRSILVECKTSRSDFAADRKKIHRRLPGLGLYRYYLCPPEVIHSADLPEGWGLLWCYPKHVKVVVQASENPERDRQGEILVMYSLLRRVAVRGQLQRCLSKKWGGEGLVPLNGDSA